LKISTDPARCAGHGRCYVIVPELFVDDEHGFSEVLSDGEVVSEHQGAANATVVGCPEHAVVLHDT
jgi:ferredoxin